MAKQAILSHVCARAAIATLIVECNGLAQPASLRCGRLHSTVTARAANGTIIVAHSLHSSPRRVQCCNSSLSTRDSFAAHSYSLRMDYLLILLFLKNIFHRS
ncbi:hypothetical protein GQ42DRAFT_164343, partial [Ramicandelaber brevisporus]